MGYYKKKADEKDFGGVDTRTLVHKSFRDLQIGGSITVKANPTAQAQEVSNPIPILNRTNIVIDANYPGDDALDGNTLSQMVSSDKSKLLNLFDIGIMRIAINYLYLGMTNTVKNKALNHEVDMAVSEAVSFAYSESLTQLPAFKATVQSSMPSVTGLTGWLVAYQTFLQNIGAIPASYNTCMGFEQVLKDMGYRREAPLITELFGLLRKASFRAKVNAISEYTLAEYFDRNWWEQVNTLIRVPSRRSEALTSPLLFMSGIHTIPETIVTGEGSEDPMFDTRTYKLKMTIDGVEKEYHISELFEKAVDALNPYFILKWAREVYRNASNVTAQGYFNRIENILNGIKLIMVKFSQDNAELRTVLDRMATVGIVYWQKGVTFDVSKSNPVGTVVYNKLVEDVFTAAVASAATMSWDEHDLRWRFFTMWDKFTGIPEYDKKSGGAFITMSLRELPTDTDYTTTKWLIPKLFTVSKLNGTDDQWFLNRKGYQIAVNGKKFTHAELAANPIFARLDVLSQAVVDLNVATVDVTATDLTGHDIRSAVYFLLNDLFCAGALKTGDATYDYCLGSDAIALLDVEMDDLGNSMISFARNYSPFRVKTPDPQRTVGFATKTMKSHVSDESPSSETSV